MEGRFLEKEEWRLVEGTEDYYISNRGRFKRGKKLRKISPDTEGYLRCNIGHQKFRIHRLVAQAFIPNPDNLPVVDHIDGNKKNNFVSNLRWVTHRENTQAAYDTGLNKGSRQKIILSVDGDGNGVLYDSQVAASEETGVPAKGISKVVRGVEPSRGGYRFVSLTSLSDHRTKLY